jgi:hypothetical protein
VPKALLLPEMEKCPRIIRRGKWYAAVRRCRRRRLPRIRGPRMLRIPDPDETHSESGAVVHRKVVGSGAAEAGEMRETAKLKHYSLELCDLCRNPLVPADQIGGICPVCRWPPDGKPPRVAKGSTGAAPKSAGLKAVVKTPPRRMAKKSGGESMN